MLFLLLRACLTAGLLAGCAPLPPSPVPSPSPVAASPSLAPVPSPTLPTFRLYVADSPPDADYLAAILAASEDWNQAVGRDVLTWHEGAPVRLSQYASIQREVLPPNHITGAVTFPGWVVFSGLVPVPRRYTVAAHELGHVLGVSHSEDPADLMHPQSRVGGTITANDARRAREALAAKEAP